ncbi:helix-turn-helix domain-containing protein [Gordonia hydrophobica]|uniref:Helix-turn-helix transcriptional regulator n=1 Tax=Gordonia hydrophobica TaxID=40516 RepID=A0ABZ2TXF0_9ACTN|nr:helix-turn-helix transcriptional regulator [Gordonia hydrophobica]MBM7366369.1 transcriptional regulator with XRE-family HTH domain [Gordonia hydrophobica]
MGQTSSEDLRTQVRNFLVSRRERLTPGDVGIPDHGRRRVKGLRREEVALLAGVSVEYYTKIERGDASGATAAVINAIARVLRLNDIEREHLKRLTASTDDADGHTRATRSTMAVRPELQRLLDALSDVPAYIVNKRLDVVAANDLGRALYAPMYESFPHPTNTARFCFLDEEASRAFWVDWDDVAAKGVAILRTEHGLRPNDEDLRALIDELHCHSADFRRRWATHDVHRHSTGMKMINHPVVGRLDLPYEKLLLPADPDLSLMTYGTEPGSPSFDALQLLRIWAADPSGASSQRKH